jgi:7,8-dihydropterin-6-yl-methyl-4-(beta-D-ribofuranosyl)aminobenzene 5'-phosphate synthase
MKLTVLTENAAGGKLQAEHGLSYFIETGERNILFDTGHTDVFLTNAEKLGIDLQHQADIVVLSHGHWDHGDGLRFIEGTTLLTHPASFMKRYRKRDNSYIGLQLGEKEAEHRFELITSRGTYPISKNVTFLGEIPRLSPFESQTTNFFNETGEPDFVPDDSALAIVNNSALVVVTGCSHAGIVNITEYAKKVTGVLNLKAVIGGFHLKHDNHVTQKTIEYFKRNKAAVIYPSHCTELPALSAFHKTFTIQQLKTGMTINL